MLGLTPIAGKNDDNENFTQANAQTLESFAASNGVGELAFWEVDGYDKGTRLRLLEDLQQDHGLKPRVASTTGGTPGKATPIGRRRRPDAAPAPGNRCWGRRVSPADGDEPVTNSDKVRRDIRQEPRSPHARLSPRPARHRPAGRVRRRRAAAGDGGAAISPDLVRLHPIATHVG